MTSRDAARLIDISAVRTQHTLKDIQDVVEIAKKYQFINVHSLPCWTKQVAELLKDEPEIYVGAPVGFPGGAHKTEVKVLEAQELVKDGVQEMDIVMNVGRFKNREYDYVLDELKQIIALKKSYMKTKVLIELNCLEDSELEAACKIVIDSGADFLKTGTGWVPGNANVERIRKIKDIVGNQMKIKAAGGIRTRAEFDELLDIGVERFGINTKSAIEIIKTFE